jgi:hypothetical protein
MRKIALLVVCLAPLAAAAQKQPRPRPAPPRAQRIDIDESDVVEAGVPMPLAETVMVRGGARHESLIRPRTTFVPEMLRDANRL